MLRLEVQIEGLFISDLTDALHQVLLAVEQGCISGQDSNETGMYCFTRTGEEPNPS